MTSLFVLVIVLALSCFESRATPLEDNSRSLRKEDIARVRTKRGADVDDEGEMNSFQELGKSSVKPVAIETASHRRKKNDGKNSNGKVKKHKSKGRPFVWSALITQLTLYGPYPNTAWTHFPSAHSRSSSPRKTSFKRQKKLNKRYGFEVPWGIGGGCSCGGCGGLGGDWCRIGCPGCTGCGWPWPVHILF